MTIKLNSKVLVKLNDAPLEIIINSLSGIKEIYAFPSTSLYQLIFLKLKKVKINIFIKKDSLLMLIN